MYILYRCITCGHTEEGEYIDEFHTLKCSKCNSIMTAELDDNVDDDIAEEIENQEKNNNIIDRETKEGKKALLKSLYGMKGNDGLWDYIESIDEYKIRAFYRQLFIDIGGQIPQRSIAI